MKQVEKNGVSKMHRNIFALQQNLTNIIQFKETHFDRVRKYYSLIPMTEKDFFSYLSAQLAENNLMFTFEEYKAVLEARQPNKKLNEDTLAKLESILRRKQ